jgi:hypothetical protein
MKKEVYAVRKELAAVRYATGEQFKNAHRKTRALHAGLFRRLAE